MRPVVGLVAKGLSKTFGALPRANLVLQGVDLAVSPGEFVALRGDNGCGKTTLLNIIARTEDPSAGTVEFTGQSSSRAVRIGYVQQDYTSSLLPWFDVTENIAIPLRLRNTGQAERAKKVTDVLEELQFNGLPRHGFPYQLSGGQKQRVAIARALIHNPQVLLLDEPFANLDAHTCRDLQEVLCRIHRDRRLTVVCVSHDMDHCVYLADRVVLLHGRPARVHRCFDVPLTRPRCRDQLLSDGFSAARQAILEEEERLYAAPQS